MTAEIVPASEAPTIANSKAESTKAPPTPPTDGNDDGAALEQVPTMTRDPVTGKYVFKASLNFKLAYAALCVLALAVAFDATTLSVALPKMSADLGGTALEAFWAGTSFLLSSCVLQPSIAALSSIFGRKYAVYGSSLFFAIGSIIAAVGGNFRVILIGRTLQGAGGGGIIALTEVIITDLVPLAVRGEWFSGLSAAWALGTVTGPLIGAGFAEDVSWRWIFWINVPIIAAGVVAIFFFLNQTRLPGGIVHKLGLFDWAGSFIFTVGSTILLFGISVGGVMYEWASYQTLLPLILGVVMIVGFFFYEFNWAKNPMISRGIFNNRTMIIAYLQAIFHGMVLWALLYFLTLYYQGVKMFSPKIAAVAVLPETLTVAPAGLVVGILAGKLDKYRWSVWGGWVLTTLGAGLLILMEPDTTTGQWIGLNIPIGIGTGMLFPATALCIQAACDPGLNAQAAAFFSFLRVFGQSIGVATSGVIFQNAFRDKLIDTGVPEMVAKAEEYSRDATIVVTIIQQMTDPVAQAALIGAYNEALKIIWYSLLAFSAFGLVIGVGIKGYTLNQKHLTDQAFVEDAAEEKKNKQSATDLESSGEGVRA